MIGRAQKALAAIGVILVAAAVFFFGGKAAARNEIKLAAAKKTAKAIQERAETNESVRTEDDLLGRARGSGVVRKP